MSKIVIIQAGQTLFDIALREYGSIEGLFLLMEDNGIDSVNHNLLVGDELTIKQDPVEPIIVEYYEENKIEINSGFDPLAGRAFSSGFSLGFS